MKSSCVIPFVVIAFLSGCAFASRNADQDNALRVDFDCDNGERLEMRFVREQGSAVLVRNGTALELAQQISGSGFIYSNGPTVVRGKGDALIIESGGMAPVKCTAR